MVLQDIWHQKSLKLNMMILKLMMRSVMSSLWVVSYTICWLVSRHLIKIRLNNRILKWNSIGIKSNKTWMEAIHLLFYYKECSLQSLQIGHLVGKFWTLKFWESNMVRMESHFLETSKDLRVVHLKDNSKKKKSIILIKKKAIIIERKYIEF